MATFESTEVKIAQGHTSSGVTGPGRKLHERKRGSGQHKGRPADRGEQNFQGGAPKQVRPVNQSKAFEDAANVSKLQESNPSRGRGWVAAMLEASRRLRITPRQEHYRGVHFC